MVAKGASRADAAYEQAKERAAKRYKEAIASITTKQAGALREQ